MIEIYPASDLIVKVIEPIEPVEEGSTQVPARTEEFRVRRATLSKASTVWSKMLNSDVYLEGRNTSITFHDNPILSTEILFRGLHGTEDSSTHEASILDVW